MLVSGAIDAIGPKIALETDLVFAGPIKGGIKAGGKALGKAASKVTQKVGKGGKAGKSETIEALDLARNKAAFFKERALLPTDIAKK